MYPEDKQFDLHAFYALKERNIVCMLAPFMTALVDAMYYIESNWRSLVHDIEVGRLDPAIEMDEDFRAEANKQLKPDPERAAELRAIFEKGFDEPVIPKIWQNCDYILAIGGGGFAPYTQKMKRYSGEKTNEAAVAWTVREFEKAAGETITDFSLRRHRRHTRTLRAVPGARKAHSKRKA